MSNSMKGFNPFKGREEAALINAMKMEIYKISNKFVQFPVTLNVTKNILEEINAISEELFEIGSKLDAQDQNILKSLLDSFEDFNTIVDAHILTITEVCLIIL